MGINTDFLIIFRINLLILFSLRLKYVKLMKPGYDEKILKKSAKILVFNYIGK